MMLFHCHRIESGRVFKYTLKICIINFKEIKSRPTSSADCNKLFIHFLDLHINEIISFDMFEIKRVVRHKKIKKSNCVRDDF